jgi:hypothetical protein
MGSDLRKHPETVDHVAISLGMALLLGDRLEARDLEACRKFILGFH